ncbi:unnamed protein product [Protopolystoma xenopodis]|uniref:Uncharacterized protein n=1 Tax=Protopolystoma xenopodis TaxID=117903 RepID=A0A448WLR0_9PLAT|nr:unnamed protein product [Protopolystoma xenopodis]
MCSASRYRIDYHSPKVEEQENESQNALSIRRKVIGEELDVGKTQTMLECGFGARGQHSVTRITTAQGGEMGHGSQSS